MYRKNRTIIYTLILTVVISLLLSFTENFSRYSREISQPGFFCNDTSLLYPHNTAKHDSSTYLLFNRVLPITVICLLELVFFLEVFKYEKRFDLLSFPTVACCLCFGYIVLKLLIGIGNILVDRVQPYYLTVCQPIFPDNTTCAEPRNHGRYHTDFECRGSQKDVIMAAKAAFPSSNASLVFFGLTFLTCYLQFRLKTQPYKSVTFFANNLLLHYIQLFLMLLAWYLALTGIEKNTEHCSDVLAGSILGAAVAVCSSNYLQKDEAFIVYMEPAPNDEEAIELE